MLTPGPTMGMDKIGTLPADGVSRVFDAGGHGSPRGEGTGVVILKTLSQARADGDRVYAVIRGTAVNHGGKGNGLLAPNRWAQEAVLREACARADILPGEIGYVEAHSTGMPIGDATELETLSSFFGPAGDAPRAGLGSVKSMIASLCFLISALLNPK